MVIGITMVKVVPGQERSVYCSVTTPPNKFEGI